MYEAVRRSRPTRRRARLAIASRWTALAVVATLAFSTSPAWAAKKPVIPSQAQVDQANASARAKATQVGQTEAELAAASAALQKLNDNVEIVVEAYDGAMAKLAAAQKAAAAAKAQLDAADSARRQAQVLMDQFAASSYRGSGDLGQFSALMTSSSPSSFMQRAGTLSAITRHDQGVINQIAVVRAQQDAAKHVADAAVANQQAASAAAAKAKDAAVKAMNDQAEQVAQIQASQADLQAQLAVLKGKAKTLAQARAQGLRELAAQAAAAAAAKKRQQELAREAAARAAAAAAAAARAAANGSPSSSGSGSGDSNGGGSSGGGVDVVAPGTGRSISTAAQRATAIAFAQAQIGVWYRWAGTGEVGPTVTSSGTQNVPGYDCSGLTMRAYQAAGISLDHYTGLQWDEGMHVSQGQLVPGDLVFFATNTSDPSTIHHVGIYIGNGQMIDAPSTGEQIGIHNAFRSDYIGAVQP